MPAYRPREHGRRAARPGGAAAAPWLCMAPALRPTMRQVRACDTERVTNLAELCAELQTTWHRDIPPAAAMGITVAGYDGRTLSVQAPFRTNRNVHGTAFAGSLFSACVLTGWGATWLALRERGLVGSIVVAESQIKYRKAVSGDILCRCETEADILEGALAGFLSSGRASLPLSCSIEFGGKLAVAFEGTYVVHASPS